MHEQDNEDFVFEVEDQPGWSTTILFAIALLILVAAFLWFVMRIDPLLSDFFPSEVPTPTAVEPEGEL